MIAEASARLTTIARLLRALDRLPDHARHTAPYVALVTAIRVETDAFRLLIDAEEKGTP